jgi:hypothetical protein
MSPVPDRLDLSELAASLIGEVRAGVLAAEDLGAGHMQVVDATVRVGQRGEAEAADSEPAAPAVEPERGPGPVITPPALSPVVLQEEGERTGWEIELRLGRGRPVVTTEAQPGVTTGDLPTAVSLWVDRPLSVLKGVDAVRTSRLAKEGVRTIADLLALDEVAIAGIVARQRSQLFLDFWVKAALLRSPAPRLAASAADTRRLATLTGLAPGTLRQLLGPEVCSASAATQLFDLLSHWGMALTRTALASVRVADLRAATRVEAQA